ncbi:DUF6161 domain-containing protein [Pseudomonas sp. AP3_22 TE3818]
MEKPSPVTTLISGKKVTFKSEADFRDYIQSEIDNWKWLADPQNAHRNQTNELYNLYFFSKLRPLQDRFDPNHPQYNDFVLGSEADPYLEKTSKEGLLIQKTREHYGNIVAALLLIYISEQNRKIARTNNAAQTFADNPQLSYERTLAIQIALAGTDVSGLIGKSRTQRLDKILEKFSYDADICLTNINTQELKFEEQVKEKTTEINSNASAIQRSFKRRNRVYRVYAKKSKEAASHSLEEAEQRLASAKAAYDDQIDLDASVQYWIKRRKSHSTFKVLWFVAVVLCMIITFASMLTYYSYGGAAGLSKYMHAQAERETIHPTTQPSINAVTPIQKSEQQLLLGHTSSELSLAIADLAGAALLITLLGVLIRIALRQFNTHSHFALDAAERITFTKTYLALLNEGKLKADEDRRLILESLFRSSQPGSLIEIPFSSPIELILKALADKKSPSV